MFKFNNFITIFVYKKMYFYFVNAMNEIRVDELKVAIVNIKKILQKLTCFYFFLYLKEENIAKLILDPLLFLVFK